MGVSNEKRCKTIKYYINSDRRITYLKITLLNYDNLQLKFWVNKLNN